MAFGKGSKKRLENEEIEIVNRICSLDGLLHLVYDYNLYPPMLIVQNEFQTQKFFLNFDNVKLF
jgi:hypothetical protein